MTRIGEVIETARRARGLTQSQLADAAEITQAALSRYENDLRDPDPEAFTRVANVLGVTTAFLERAGRRHGGVAINAHMRRRATASPGVWRQLESQLNMYRWHASHLFEEVTIRAEQSVPTIDVMEATPSEAARFVRAQWRMPIGPVHDLVRWLENAGCLVFIEDFSTSRVDGMSQWIDDHPVILVNSAMPADRMRLTLAHELGHLVMHTDITIDQDVELEANQFAGEFLMPEDLVRPALRNLKIAKLLDLKREYGVSMQALVERAYHLELISPSQRTNMYKMFSARGWRKNVPGSEDIPVERATLPEAIGSSLADRGLDPDEVARIVGFANARENNLFKVSGLHLAR